MIRPSSHELNPPEKLLVLFQCDERQCTSFNIILEVLALEKVDEEAFKKLR